MNQRQQFLSSATDAHNQMVHSLAVATRQQHDAFAYASQLLSQHHHQQQQQQYSFRPDRPSPETLQRSDNPRIDSYASVLWRQAVDASGQQDRVVVPPRLDLSQANMALSDSFDARVKPRSPIVHTGSTSWRPRDKTVDEVASPSKKASAKKTNAGGADGGTFLTLSDQSFAQIPADKRKTAPFESFPEKLHRILKDAEADAFDDIISFYPNGRSFGVHDPKRFLHEIMPRYFNTARYPSFQRQLNLYGFNKCSVGKDNKGFFHELFIKDHPDRCLQIKRKKQKVPMGDIYHPFLDDPAILATSMTTPTMQMQAAALHQYEASVQGMQSNPMQANLSAGTIGTVLPGFNQAEFTGLAPRESRGHGQANASLNIAAALMERQRRTLYLASLQPPNQRSDQSSQKDGKSDSE